MFITPSKLEDERDKRRELDGRTITGNTWPAGFEWLDDRAAIHHHHHHQPPRTNRLDGDSVGRQWSLSAEGGRAGEEQRDTLLHALPA